jgi:hypothetical protein
LGPDAGRWKANPSVCNISSCEEKIGLIIITALTCKPIRKIKSFDWIELGLQSPVKQGRLHAIWHDNAIFDIDVIFTESSPEPLDTNGVVRYHDPRKGAVVGFLLVG